MAEPDFGSDISCLGDLDPSFATVTGNALVAQMILNALNTPGGWLAQYCDDDPEYGFDLLGLVNADIQDSELPSWESQIEAQCKRIPFVDSATAEITYTRETGAATVDISVVTASGPFDLVLGISDMGVDLLSVDGDPVAASPIYTTVVGDPGPRGATGPAGSSGGGSGSTMIEVSNSGEFLSDSASEEIVYESAENFSVFNSGVSLTVNFIGILKALGSAVGTFRVRVGGTTGVVDGTVRATITRTSPGTTWLTTLGTFTFANPFGTQPVKITAQTNIAGSAAYIKGSSATFTLT